MGAEWCDCMYSRDSVSLAAESWTTSASSVTSPARRHYDNSPRDKKYHSVCGGDSKATSGAQLGRSDVVDSVHRGRRLDLAASAAAAAAGDDDDDATSVRRNEMTRTAVRPWLIHTYDHWHIREQVASGAANLARAALQGAATWQI